MLHLSCTLHDHGWATITICDGQSALEMEATYLSDALGDLARSARGIMRGMSEAGFAFEQEPGQHRVSLTRAGNVLHLRILRFADAFSRKTRGELVWTGQCSIRECATACINCLRRTLDQHGVEGYLWRWKNHPFPLQEYHDLLELRRQLPT